MDKYYADDVYGIVRDVPLNYVARRSVDEKFIEDLSRDKHIVIYGSSKQGKTCLRKHCLSDDEYIVVQCSNRWALADLHTHVLKRAGFEVTQSETKATSGRNKVMATLSAKFLGSGVDAGAETESTDTTQSTTAPLELDPADVNDVITALNNIRFDKFIVIEDFHYLSVEVQQDFAVALKAFHEASDLTFIIVGVWLEENRMIVYNGDLTGRVVAVNADEWQPTELSRVIDDGAELLNVRFDNDFKTRLIQESNDSVYIVQEACRQACAREGIHSTQERIKEVGRNLDVHEIVEHVVNEQTGRYLAFITQFAEGFQETRLEMYRWLLLPILTASPTKLEKGFKYAELRRALQEHHPQKQDLNPGNLTQALKSAASLQVAKDIKPIILDYDQSNLRLNVVDRGFLIWLEQQNKDELLEVAGLHLAPQPNGSN
jgi:hypothetical protein